MAGYTGKAFVSFLLIVSFGKTVFSQENIPQLDLEEYQIVGRDTRVFQITGDKIPAITPVSTPLPLPEEMRINESSQAIIPEDERLWRLDSFNIERRPYTRAEAFVGSKTAADIRGRGSLDFTGSGVTLDVTSRGARQHTPENLPPTSQQISATGYRDLAGARLMGSFSFRRDREDLLTDPFRGLDRAADMYDIDLSLRTRLMRSWDVAAAATVSNGSFSDNQLKYDKDELFVVGKLNAEGRLYGFETVLTGETDLVKLDGDTGSKLAAGISMAWLPWQRFSISFGANGYLFGMPGDDTKLRIYPSAGIDWRIARRLYMSLYFKPSVITHSYQDIYSRNALALPIPVLYETRKIDAGGEIGFDINDNLILTLSGFHSESDDRPVYSSSTGYFTVLRGVQVDVTGFAAGFEYNPQGRWGIAGEYRHRDVSWDNPGNAPFEPADLAVIQGHYIPADKLRVYASARYWGSHYTALGSNDTVDSFLTLDLGGSRELWEYLSVYTEVKNLTNAGGAWWTNDYGIPGIGLYAGIRARY